MKRIHQWFLVRDYNQKATIPFAVPTQRIRLLEDLRDVGCLPCITDMGGDGVGIPEAEVAFFEAKSKMDPVEDDNPYIIHLDVDTLGKDEGTRKSRLEEVAQRYKELIQSGHSPDQIQSIEAAQLRESLRH